MIWQNDGRRSDPLVSWGAEGGGKTERKKLESSMVWENLRAIVQSLHHALLSFFCSPLFVLHSS